MTDAIVDELIDHARHLARPDHQAERRVASEADLRRAVSAAYYALFHEVTHLVAVRLTVRLGDQTADDVRRHFAHRAMNTVCGWVMDKGTLPKSPAVRALAPIARTSDSLALVARAFSALQEQRHAADYDHRAVFTSSDAALAVGLARDAVDELRDAAYGEDEPQIDAFVLLVGLFGGSR